MPRVISLSSSGKPPHKAGAKKPVKTITKPEKKEALKKTVLRKPSIFNKPPKKTRPPILYKPKNAPAPITPEPGIPFVDNEKLPATYDSTDVTLMVRDPYWIHAFWETAPSSVEKVKKRIGAPFKKSVYTLRVHDITVSDSGETCPRTSFDIDVDPKARNWYINLWRDNVTYFADFGVRTPNGDFYPLARSNTVTTPRATVSEMPDVTWMNVKGNGAYSIVNYPAERPQAPGKKSPALSGHEALAQDLPTVPVTAPSQETDDDVILQNALSSRMDASIPSHTSEADSTKELPPTDFAGFLVPEPSRSVLLGGSSAYMGGASELQSRNDFLFDLNTELVVYGRTEPGADVWMGTQKINIREDGTFSLRLALPEGAVPLDFTARTLDKAGIKAVITAVHRTQTRYV